MPVRSWRRFAQHRVPDHACSIVRAPRVRSAHSGRGQQERLRPWGETSEASGGTLAHHGGLDVNDYASPLTEHERSDIDV